MLEKLHLPDCSDCSPRLALACPSRLFVQQTSTKNFFRTSTTASNKLTKPNRLCEIKFGSFAKDTIVSAKYRHGGNLLRFACRNNKDDHWHFSGIPLEFFWHFLCLAFAHVNAHVNGVLTKVLDEGIPEASTSVAEVPENDLPLYGKTESLKFTATVQSVCRLSTTSRRLLNQSGDGNLR